MNETDKTTAVMLALGLLELSLDACNHPHICIDDPTQPACDRVLARETKTLSKAR